MPLRSKVEAKPSAFGLSSTQAAHPLFKLFYMLGWEKQREVKERSSYSQQVPKTPSEHVHMRQNQ